MGLVTGSILLLLISSAYGKSEKPSSIFTAVSSKLIRPNSAYEVLVSVETSGQPTTFFLEIKGSPPPIIPDPNPEPIVVFNDVAQVDGRPRKSKPAAAAVTQTTPVPKKILPVQSYKSKEENIEPGSSKIISIKIRDLKYDEYNLTIKAVTSTEQKYEETTSIFKDYKTVAILIQTDKPIYKPGEEVKLRVVVLNRELCPLQPSSKNVVEELDLIIKDPRRNIIKDLKRQAIKNGFFSYRFQLSDEPNLGDWNIQATLKKANSTETDEEYEPDDDENPDEDDYEYIVEEDYSGKNVKTSSMSFTVDQYILPKFKIDLKTNPTFVTYNNSKVVVEIDAKYTYGKPMVGFCQVILSEAYPYYYYEDYSTDNNGNPNPRQRQREISKQAQITEDGTVFIEFDIMKDFIEKLRKNDPNFEGRYQREFKFLAIVTDTTTSRQQNITKNIIIYEYPYKMELVNSPSNYKPGFPLKLFIKVATQDDVPVSDPSPKALTIRHGFSFKTEDGIIKSSIPADGLVKITLQMPTNELMSTNGMEVEYKGQIQHLYPPQKIWSNSKSYIQLTLKDDKNSSVSLYYGVKLNCKINKAVKSLNYILFGHGEILKQAKMTFDKPKMEHDFELEKLPAGAAPESVLIVYCVIEDSSNEIIADSIQIKPIEGIVLKNGLSMKMSKGPTVEPGENISLHVATSENSLVALRGIDQSVLLLKQGQDNDITLKRVEDEARRFQTGWANYRVWGGGAAFQIFEQSGLHIISNGKLEKERWSRPLPYFRRPFARRLGFAAGAPGMAFEEADEGAPVRLAKHTSASNNFGAGGLPIRTRTNFPESWFWEEVYMNDSTRNIAATVPDTLTSWIITGFSLHNKNGIGISNAYEQQVFRPFFLTLNVPYSVVKGETFGLQVLVHNYLKETITTEITLNNIGDSIEYNEKINKARKFLTKKITVESSSVSSIIFVITPIRFGIIKLNVKGVTDYAGDQLEQPLIVKPPGHKVVDNTAVLATVGGNDPENISSHSTVSLKADFPLRWVTGTEEIKVSIVGDVLGSSIHNLDRLLALPTGCGEQNMLNFVPDVLILDYLKATGSLTKRVEEKALKFLEIGYQRELTYRHHDGSFSAFGQSDSFGSTWLTAFVIRSFIAARPYITIDPNVISGGLQFLIQKQHTDGSFIEFGQVLHHDLKGGGADNNLALSAYVLLALLEARGQNFTKANEAPEVDKAIDKGLVFLEDSLSVAQNNTYSISLITYTLTVANHKAKDSFFEQLQFLLTEDEGGWIHWENPQVKSEPSEDDKDVLLYHWRTQPSTIEMTAYGLLTYLARNDLTSAVSIVHWLIDQRNERGGFSSTQDTIVGLTALAKFAAITKSTPLDMQLKAIYYYKVGDDDFKKVESDFKIDSTNSLVLQELYLPKNITKKQVTFELQGKGSVIIYMTWSYYLEEPLSLKLKPFMINIKVHPNAKLPSEIKLEICSRVLSKIQSNMIVQEITLPSGYTFSYDDVQEVVLAKKMTQLIKRFDLQEAGTKLEIYYDYFLSNTTNCLLIPANQIFKVSNPSRAYVQIIDYYDTTMKQVAYYRPPTFTTCDICKGRDNEVAGAGEESAGIDKECQIQNC